MHISICMYTQKVLYKFRLWPQGTAIRKYSFNLRQLPHWKERVA